MREKMKFKFLAQNAVSFAISSFGTRFLSFFLIYIYTKELSTVEYGTIDVITTTVQILVPILTINIQDAVLRFGLDEKYKKSEVINVGLRIVFWGDVFLGGLIFILYQLSVFEIEINYWLFLYMSFVCGGMFNVFSMYLKAKNEIRALVVWGTLNTAITLCANIILLSICHTGIDGYIIASLLGNLITNIGMFFGGHVYEDLKERNYSKRLLLPMIAYSSPLIANSLGWWINAASDRYILTYFWGAEINGIYAISYKIPSILAAVQSVFYNAWSISAIKEFDKNDSDGFIGKVYTTYSLTSFLMTSLVMLFNLYIARVLFFDKFFNAWRYVPVLMVGTVFNGLGLFNGCIFTAVKKTKEVASTTMWGAMVNIFLNILLIPHLGAMGAAIATMMGYISIWLIRMIKLRNIIRMRVEWKKQFFCIIILLLQSIMATWNGSIIYQIPFCILLVWYGRNIYSTILKKGLLLINRHVAKSNL